MVHLNRQNSSSQNTESTGILLKKRRRKRNKACLRMKKPKRKKRQEKLRKLKRKKGKVCSPYTKLTKIKLLGYVQHAKDVVQDILWPTTATGTHVDAVDSHDISLRKNEHL
jgi:hypothetical protein